MQPRVILAAVMISLLQLPQIAKPYHKLEIIRNEINQLFTITQPQKKSSVTKAAKTEDTSEQPRPPKKPDAGSVQNSAVPSVSTQASAFYPLTKQERTFIEGVVMAEAGNQPYNGKIAVAQCILNRCRIWNKTVTQILTQKNQFAPPHKKGANDEVKKAVSAVFDRGDSVTSRPILWFYAPKYGNGKFHESKVFVAEIGDHRFFCN